MLNGRTRAKLRYVQGFVRACGADEHEVALWSTAFRRVYEGLHLAEETAALVPLPLRTEAG
ncbi:hypothetical protein [Actinoallomurus sp. NPDC050550]|uniref:hypothetical protein n=1 Tax=Actinoallomurus sp. NPDC050550 TaxID=3154937 RepID=UPI0033F87E03